jgi:hypothetical protein
MSEHQQEVEALVTAVRPLFAGKPPEVQGAALADLLALWIAGHVAHDPADKAFREELLELHLKTVRALIPINYRTHIEPLLAPPPRKHQ